MRNIMVGRLHATGATEQHSDHHLLRRNSIRDEQKKEPAPLGEARRLKVMELTATSRSGGEVFGLTKEEREAPAELPDPPTEPIHHAWRRQMAKKAIQLHENKDEKKLADEIANLAL